jgi:DNA polymerase-3 subunit delta'
MLHFRKGDVMSFNDIVGQERVIKILTKSLKENKVSSSYIFVGGEGTGKKLTAIEFAKALNCLNLSKGTKACENCQSCTEISKQSSPDLKIIEPIKSSIKIEQIREMRKEVGLKPFKNKKKVYIIDKAEKMTLEASNCLLKTIEEPPYYAIIILICSKIDPILPTIVSRCQIINFGLITSLKIKELLLNKINDLEKGKAEIISKLAQGSIGKAFNLAIDKEYFIRREEIIGYLSAISPGKYSDDVFIKVEKVVSEIDRIEEILEMVKLWYRDILIIKNTGDHKYVANCDKLEVLDKKSQIYSQEILIDILDYLEQAEEYLIKNVNKRLILERLYIKMVGVEYCLK